MNIRCLVFGIFLALHCTTNVSVKNLCANVRTEISFLIKNGIFIKFTNLVCDNFNKSWVTFHECLLRAVNHNKTVLNFNATFHYPVNEMDVDV